MRQGVGGTPVAEGESSHDVTGMPQPSAGRQGPALNEPEGGTGMPSRSGGMPASQSGMPQGTNGAGTHAARPSPMPDTEQKPAALRESPRPGASGRPSGPGTSRETSQGPQLAAGRAGTAALVPAEPPVPRALLAMTVVSVGLVTVVCAVVSYSHARHLAELAGQGGLAPWLPLAVDGLVAAATCSLLVDRRHGDRGHPLAWLGVGLGLAGSFGANVVAVDPMLVDLRHVRWVLAGYVPAALAISGHLLMRMLGEQHHPASGQRR